MTDSRTAFSAVVDVFRNADDLALGLHFGHATGGRWFGPWAPQAVQAAVSAPEVSLLISGLTLTARQRWPMLWATVLPAERTRLTSLVLAMLLLAPDEVEEFEERAGIMHFDGGVPTEYAEVVALSMIASTKDFAIRSPDESLLETVSTGAAVTRELDELHGGCRARLTGTAVSPSCDDHLPF